MASIPDLPIPISIITSRYFVFSADAGAYLRRQHNIVGVLIGSIPQIPQQNIFLGLPLELMPEEARLLVENKVAYIVDDPRAHDESIWRLEQDKRAAYLASLNEEGERAAGAQAGEKLQKREKALRRRGLASGSEPSESKTTASSEDQSEEAGDGLLGRPGPSTSHKRNPVSPTPPAITPPTSQPLLNTRPPEIQSPSDLPPVPASYPLFKHLHGLSYYLTPGLRFGCQYLVYPGDPLRFHSHFLAVSYEWDEEIDLMELVGGGRLGTGVKKGFLIGGLEPADESGGEGEDTGSGSRGGKVRSFSVEWAGM